MGDIRGHAFEHVRALAPIPKASRRRCPCGCKRRATHNGMANGVTLYMGCELSARRWVRDGFPLSNRTKNND